MAFQKVRHLGAGDGAFRQVSRHVDSTGRTQQGFGDDPRALGRAAPAIIRVSKIGSDNVGEAFKDLVVPDYAGVVFYYRVHRPVVLLEFDHQLPANYRPAGLDPKLPSPEHIHGVVRTPNGNDYGKDLWRLPTPVWRGLRSVPAHEDFGVPFLICVHLRFQIPCSYLC